MLTVLEIIKRTTDFFAGKGIDSSRLNAELLIGHALGLKRMELYLQFERPLLEVELEKIRPLVRRRGQQEPLQYILGETEFHGLRLKCDRRALIPRPETERLVELAIAACASSPESILDLGTGSGAIALALAQAFPNASVTAVDRSEDALSLARENANATGLSARIHFVRSNWFAALSQESRFALIVANPPYLTAAETAATAVEVKGFEPIGALTSEDQGLADLRHILTHALQFLTTDGIVALETGVSHHPALVALSKDAGFSHVESHRDLTGRDRVVIARR